MSFLRIFGLGMSKIEVTHTKNETPEGKALEHDLRQLADRSSTEAADKYTQWITHEVFSEVVQYHSYLDQLWGSRKFGRLMNHCAGFLDLERSYGEFPAEDFDIHLEQGFWMCLLCVIPVKRLYFYPDSEDAIKEVFIRWMMAVGRMSNDQILNVIDSVFAWEQLDVIEMQENPGRFSANAFHDAMRLEEMSFGVRVDLGAMRTHLGKNEVYRAYAAKSIANNRQPDWVLLLQDKLNVSGFAAPGVELMNQSVDGF